jgi:hypothetical protein
VFAFGGELLVFGFDGTPVEMGRLLVLPPRTKRPTRNKHDGPLEFIYSKTKQKFCFTQNASLVLSTKRQQDNYLPSRFVRSFCFVARQLTIQSCIAGCLPRRPQILCRKSVGQRNARVALRWRFHPHRDLAATLTGGGW